MRTDTPTTRGTAADRLRAEFGRARRRFRSQPPPVRWSLGLAALAALAAVAYASAGPTAPTGAYVRSGDRFAADELVAVGRALTAKHLRYRVNDRRQVEVAADQLDAANDALAKLEIGPRPFTDIVNFQNGSSPWDSPSAALQRQDRAQAATLEEMIRPMDGVVSAHVIVNRPKPRGGLSRTGTGATAFVWLETEGDRELTSATVDAIQGLIAGAVPEVKADAVSVFDRKGRHYLDHRDPAIGAEAKNRRHRDALRQEIVDKLDWLKGVQVSVRLVAAPAIPLPPLPPPGPSEPPAAAPPPPVQPTSVGVNQPLDLGDEPAPPPPPPHSPAPPAATPAPAAPAGPPAAARARVWVKVPRSFYLKAMPHREPSLDDLQPLVERTKGLVETAVRHVVPPGELEEPVVISTIPDELPAQGPPPAPQAEAGSRRLPAWWAPAAVALAATAGGVAAAVLLAARRPALLRPAARPRDDHGRYKIDDASDPGPGPSERVRDLIRINPEAAASVLHRWTGQGGPYE